MRGVTVNPRSVRPWPFSKFGSKAMTDLILRNARVIDPLNGTDGVRDVAVEGGKIEEVSACVERGAPREIDCSGLMVQPGVIDSHVHLGSMYGSHYGHRMLAMEGVTTCLDMAGPLESILEEIPRYGAGLNVAVLEAAYPPFTIPSASPTLQEIHSFVDRALEGGALGMKLLGGHFPISPETASEFIRCARSRGGYAAWHAGSSEHGSNIEGMLEAIEVAGGAPLHLAHINAYCRGAVKHEAEEARIAIEALEANPNIICESYLSQRNGTRLTVDREGRIMSRVTATCLTRFGFSADAEGLKRAFRAEHAFVSYDAGGYTGLKTGEEGIRAWEEAGRDTTGCFNVNPAVPRAWLASAKRADGSFVVDAISTDGGVFPRNVIIPSGLLLVEFGALTLPEFVVKTSLNPARMLRLRGKGHFTPGADADITVVDLTARRAVAAFVAGRPILEEGRLTGSGATLITTARGEKALAARGLPFVTVDPLEPFPERFVPRL